MVGELIRRFIRCVIAVCEVFELFRLLQDCLNGTFVSVISLVIVSWEIVKGVLFWGLYFDVPRN